MFRKTSFALLAMAAVVCASPAFAECKLKVLASANIVVHPGGGVLVPVRIGEHDVWMSLRMSGGIAMISPAAVPLLGLKTTRTGGDAEVYSGGLRVEQDVRVDSLIIGGANFTDWVLYVSPRSAPNLPQWDGRPIIGTLSARFMNVVDMELDLSHGKLNLFQQTQCGGEQIYWTREHESTPLWRDDTGLLYFSMELGGKAVLASLNTEYAATRMSEKAARQLFRFSRDPGYKAPGIPDGLSRAVGSLPADIEIDDLKVEDVRVVVYDDLTNSCELDRVHGALGFVACRGMVPLSVGTEQLQHLRVYVASREGRIYFTGTGPAKSGPAPSQAASP